VSRADIKARLQADIHAALRAGDKTRLGALRMLLSDARRREIDGGKEIDEAGLAEVAAKLVRQRKESAEQFEAGKRPELAERERAELAVLEAYLPPPLGEDELAALIEESLRETGAATPRDMGKAMAYLRPKIAARADASAVAAKIKARLAGGG
jgi:uncharacterized protein YqeY